MSRGDIPVVLNAVTDEMVDALALAATPDDVHHQLEGFDGLSRRGAVHISQWSQQKPKRITKS